MERDFLKKLDIDPDAIDKVMAQYGKDVQGYKDEAEQAKSSAEELKKQLSDRDIQIKDFKKSAGDNQELQSKLDDALAKNKEQAKQYDEKIAGIKKDNAISNALRDAGAKNSKAVSALMDLEKVSLDDNGNLIGIDDQIKNLKKSDSYLFKQAEDSAKPKPKFTFSGNATDGTDKKQTLADKIAERMAKG